MRYCRLPFSGLLLAWLAIAGVTLIAQPRLEPADPIVLTPAEPVPLGTFRSYESRTARFRIRNNAQDPIRIDRVRAGCACTAVASYTQTPIPPGASGEVELTILGRLLPEGPFARTAFVELGNSPVASLVLRYEGTIVCAVRVTPSRDVQIGTVAGTDADWHCTLEIQAGPGETGPLVLGEPCVTGPAKARLTEQTRGRYLLTVSPQSPPPGPLMVDIQLPVLVPEGLPPELITVRGHIGPRLVVEPTVLDIPEGRSSLQRELHVSVRDGRRSALVADELTVLAPPGVTARAMAEPAGVLVVLQIAAEARQPGTAGVVEIRSRVAPPVQVPYYVLQPPRRVSGGGLVP